MYIPKHFHETDADALAAFVDRYSFGALLTAARGRPFATHVPFLYEREAGLLHCHVARANPQWRDLAAAPDVMVMFEGPHAYVSPTWYADAGVPTWNYAVVHVYGTARAVDDAALVQRHVEQLAARYERGRPNPWVPDYDVRKLAGIVGIEIRIGAIEGKFKLSQNRSAADRANVVAALRATGTDNDAELARLMAAAAPPPS